MHDDLVPVIEYAGWRRSAEALGAEPAMRMRVMSVLSRSGLVRLAEVAVDGSVVDVDALVGELAVDEREDRAGVDLDLSVVVECQMLVTSKIITLPSSCQTLISGWASDFTLPSRSTSVPASRRGR